MICIKLSFQNSQSTIAGITLFPDEELFILALYFTLLQQPISILLTFSSASFYYNFCLFCEVTFMISLYTSDYCGCAARSESNTETAKLSLMVMLSLSLFCHVYLPESIHGP